jgi:heat shock protein 4
VLIRLNLNVIGVSPLLGKFIVSGMGALEKPQKIKVRVKLNIHSCLQVTGAEMVEVLPAPEQPASSPTAAGAAAATPAAGAAPATPATDAKDDEETPMDEKEDATKAKPATPPPAGATADGAAPAKAADGTTPAAAAPAPKQKVKKTELKVSPYLAAGFDQKTLSAAYETEGKMEDADQVVRDTSLAKNNLEAYILDMGNKLKGELKEYFKEKDANDFNDKLMTTEEWLYDSDGGADAQKSEYKSRRDALAAVGDAAAARRNETLNRESFITPFKVNSHSHGMHIYDIT